MNKQAISSLITPESMAQVASRRDTVRGFGKWGAGLALASVPVGLAAMAKRAFAQQERSVTDVLNFALTLEYLEAEFYNIGMATSGLIPAVDRTIFGTIQDHENAHVEFLLAQLGGDAVAKPTFDFTAGGTFPDVFTNYATFRALAQGFEDTGVRAYKGQAGFLIGAPDVLTAALTIHSVEARHASEVRRLNGNFTEEEPQQGWITEANPGVVPAAVGGTPVGSAIYGPGQPVEQFPSEANTTHATIDVSGLDYDLDIAPTAFSESYDEPLDTQTVLAIAGLFIVA